MICQNCKGLICEVEDCTRRAEFEGWMDRGTIKTIIRVCPEHIYVTIGGARDKQDEFKDHAESMMGTTDLEDLRDNL